MNRRPEQELKNKNVLICLIIEFKNRPGGNPASKEIKQGYRVFKIKKFKEREKDSLA